MARRKPLKILYNTQLNCAIKELPIVGNQISNLLIKNFDEDVTVTFSGTGTDNGLDRIKAYRSTACRKVTIANNQSAKLTYILPAAMDMHTFSSSTRNYSVIKKTGKYKASGSYKDFSTFVLNMGSSFDTTYSVPPYLWVYLYSGDTKYTKFALTPIIDASTAYKRYTYQCPLDAAHCTYYAGFLDVDFETITKIEIEITTVSVAATGCFYFHNMNIAYPKYDSSFCTDSYYVGQGGAEVTEGNSIFVSWLFGDDNLAGTDRSIPVKTIEKAISLITSTYKNVVILDSETYKPIALNYTYAGIKQTLGQDFTIIADYLETPVISAEPGIINTDRVGARAENRTAFYKNQAGAGAKITVGVTGADYTNINDALAAASSGDCIEVIDSGTYTESLTVDKAITIQAAPGKLPIWTHESGSTLIDFANYGVTVQGFILEGLSAASEQLIIAGSSSLGAVQNIIDCTITKVGTSTGTATGVFKAANNTDCVVNVENCTFVGNGENFIAVENESATGGTCRTVNCKGYMGITANNYFLKAGKASATYANDMVIYGNRILAGSDTAKSYAVYIADAAAAATYTDLYFYLNDFNNLIEINGANSLLVKYYINNNYAHDHTATGTVAFIGAYAITAGVQILQGNLFYNINGSEATPTCYAVYVNTSTGQVFDNNIFIDCHSVCMYGFNVAITADYNMAYNCYIGFYAGNTQSINNWIVKNCTYGFKCPSGTLTALNCLYYNSTDNKNVTHTPDLPYDPAFIDPDNFNFGWYYDSPIETYACFGFVSPFIYPDGAYTLNLMFLDLQGFTGQAISTAQSTLAPKYCYIHDWTIGVNNALGYLTDANNLYKSNNIANRVASTAIAVTGNSISYSIYDNNDTAMILKSGCAIDHISAINGNYGLTEIFTGFYAENDFMASCVTVTNSIFARNAAWDYIGTLKTDYCIIPRRLSDSYAVTSLLYKNTKGVHDIDGQPELDAITYFPDTLYTGFIKNSPAWEAASDTYVNGMGITTHLNIGARCYPSVLSELDYDEYDFNYTGVVDAEELFYALENPQTVTYRLQPINNESTRSIAGEYQSSPTAYIPEMLLQWTTPGTDAKIIEAGRAAFEGAFQTFWVIALSEDFGAVWTWYKVDKDAAIEMTQQSWVFDSTVAPYGEFSLHLFTQPSTWSMSNFLINNLGL